MREPIDPILPDATKLPPNALRLLDEKAPMPLKQMASRGVAPGLKPFEALAVVALLSVTTDTTLRSSATATLEKLPPQLIASGLTPELDPGAIEVLGLHNPTNPAVMQKLLMLPQIAPTTVARFADVANEAVAELIATNEERMLAEPRIIEALYMNKSTRMSTADRALELAVRNKVELKGIPAFREAAAAIVNELIVEPQDEPTYDDILFKEAEEIAEQIAFDAALGDTHEKDEETGEEKLKEDMIPLHAKLLQMTISQKIRRAAVGSAAERMILVRDSNKLVASAAIRSPALQENEVVLISANRTVSDDVLRIIAMSKEWTRSHQVKLNLVKNPRTPFAFAAKLIPHLRENEIRELTKSKAVTGAVQTAAKQQMNRKGKP